MPVTEAPKTYVLAGDDWNGALKEGNAIYAKTPNYEVIHAKPGESLEDAVAKIKPPANVILACHGGEDGTFVWHNDEVKDPSYKQLLTALPREGIANVTISSCYGGSAEKEAILSAAPPGTTVQSQVGAHNCGDGRFTTEFAKAVTAHHSTSPTEIFLDSLNVFNPKQYEKDATEWNKSGKYGVLDTNPEHALPHMLGMGGKPPVVVDMDQQIDRITRPGTAPLEPNALRESIKELHARMTTAYGPNGEVLHDAASHTRLSHEIDTVATKLMNHQKPEGAEEKRIAYALTAAYINKSGELEHSIAVAKNHGQEPVHPPQPHQEIKPQTPEKPPVPPHPEPHPQTHPVSPDLGAIHKVVDNHHLVTANRNQSAEVTNALEKFASTMRIQGVRTDAHALSDAEIRKIQAALHVQQDGKVGEKTLAAMEQAEKVHALPTPSNGQSPQAHTR